MYYELNESELNLIEKVSSITGTDYGLRNNLVKVENLISIIDDLKYELDHEKERYEDLENDVRDNYKPISKSEQYEISNGDFI